ncbi:MAG TPA: hypothetical protein VGB08_03755 [Allosphingosinicella sp.]|jgi:hypothetical protein
MTFLGVIGILIGLIAIRWAYIEPTRLRFAHFALCYILHLAATFAYYEFSKANLTDAGGYYYDYVNFYQDVGFGVGTLFVTYIVQSLKSFVGGTFLDFFLIFQAISFFAICLLMRTIEEIYRELGVEQPLYTYVLPLLPGLHFWTCAIGKDGFLLLGVCLGIWSAMNLKSRWPAMLLGLLLMLLIRPHIAALGVAAVGGTIFFDRQTRPALRVAIVFVSLIGLAVAANSFRQAFSIDVTNADSVSNFLAAHEEVTQDADVAGNSAVYGSYPFKLMSLLFRPMFIDAEDIMGLAASAENFILLLLFGGIFVHFRTLVLLTRRLRFVRFAALFGATCALLLALVYYNIGLGLRQKTMFVPAVIILFVAVVALARARRLLPLQAAAAAPVAAAAAPPASAPEALPAGR